MAGGDKGPFIKLYFSLWDDKRLTSNEKLVLISLLRHYNTEKQRAWPSLNVIALECVFSRVVVWQTLKTLEEKGFIKTEKTAGKVTQYALRFYDEPIQNLNTTHSESESVGHTTHSESEPVNSRPIQNLNGGYSESERVPIQNLNTTHSESEPELDIRTRTNRTRSTELKKHGDFAADFEEFWRAYPKPQNPDKTPGRKRYIALREKGVSADDLLQAARGYAEAMRRQRTEPRYIKRCATFLGPQEPWRDYVTEPGTTAAAETDGPPSAEELFPNMAAWWKRMKEANGDDGQAGLDRISGVPWRRV